MDRLDFLASLVKDSNTVVDIGCDHGKTLIYALKKYNVKKAYGIDISKYAIDSAKKNIEGSNLDITFLVNNGLLDLDINFDSVILSGIGAHTIISIIKDSLEKFKNKKIIIESHSKNDLLRLFLIYNGFDIIDEYFINSKGKDYVIMIINTSNFNGDLTYLKYGYKLLDKNDKNYISFLNSKYNDLIKYNKCNNNNIYTDEIEELEYILKKYNKINYYDNYKNYSNTFYKKNHRHHVFIFPGGGYFWTSYREAENYSIKLMANNISSTVFHYTNNIDYKVFFNNIYTEILRIIDEYNLVSYSFLGFSAGGHLALYLANKNLYKLNNLKCVSLLYPVVNINDNELEFCFKNLFKDDYYNVDIKNKYDILKNDFTKYPELFIVIIKEDKLVNSKKNSYELIKKYKDAKTNVISLEYDLNTHGISLGTTDTARNQFELDDEYSKWFTKYIIYLKSKES